MLCIAGSKVEGLRLLRFRGITEAPNPTPCRERRSRQGSKEAQDAHDEFFHPGWGGGGKGGAAEVETNVKWSEEMLRVCHGL